MVTYYRLLNQEIKMNQSSSSSDQNKMRVLLSSSFAEMRKVQRKADLPQILDKERTLSIQNTLDTYKEENENLRQELLLLQQKNQEGSDIEKQNQLINIFKSKANNFLEVFNEFYKAFIEQENTQINQISQTLDRYKFQIQQINELIPGISNDADLQSKESKILQLQKDIINLQSQSQTINSLNTQYTEENNELKDLLRSAENTNNLNNDLINELKAELNEKNQLIESLQQQNQEKDEKIQSMQAKSSQSSLNQDYDDSGSFNFTMQDINSSLTDSNSQKNIEILNSKIDQLQSIINEKDTIIANLNKMLNESQNEKTSLLSSIQQKDFEISKIKTNSIDNRSATLLQQKLDEITRENQIKDEEINSLKHQISISASAYRDDQIKSLSSHVVSLADENTQLKEEIQKVQNSNRNYLEKIQNLQDAKSLLSNTNLDLNARIDDLEARLNQSQKNATSNTSNNQSNEIQKMKELFERNKEQDNQKINSLLKQVQETLNYSEKVKNDLISVRKENAQLQSQIQLFETNLRSTQFTNSILEKKIKTAEESNNQKEMLIQQLTDSKKDLKQRYEELIESNVNLKNQFDQSNKRISSILGCRPDINEILRNLTSTFEKLIDLQSAVVFNNDAKKEIDYLRQANLNLNNRLKKKEEINQSNLSKIKMCIDGNDSSDVVKKITDDFRELNTEYSNLIEEHKKLQDQMFLSESAFKEIESKLIDQKKINEELLKKSEKIDLYEFVTSHFIDFLSSLSSSLISPLIQDSFVHKKRLSAVDNLRVQLKKKNFSIDRVIDPWDNFCSVVHESFVFDPIEGVKSNIDHVMYTIDNKMGLIFQRINENKQRIDKLAGKKTSVDTNATNTNIGSSKIKTGLSLYQRSLRDPDLFTKTPAALRERLARTPIMKSNPLARDSPNNILEPKIEHTFM